MKQLLNKEKWLNHAHFWRFSQVYAYLLRSMRMLGRLGTQSRTAKRYRSQFYEKVWREAADELGANVKIAEKGIIEIRRGNREVQVHNNRTQLDSTETIRLSRNKVTVRTILRSSPLPTPNDAEFSLREMEQAYHFLAQYRRCVVKPAYGTGAGSGITTGVEDRHQLFRAALRAGGYCSRMLIEEEVEGDTIRLLYLDGQLLDAVRRHPPTIIGDGRSSIRQLVDNLNLQRLNAGYSLAQSILKYDMDMELTLKRQGTSWRSVPCDGERVVLKGVINDNMASENVSVAGEINESIIAAGRLASELIGVRLAGVDIITQDIGRDLKETGGKILEVNTTPGYHYHYFTRNGTCRVAVPILEACLKNCEYVFRKV